MNIKQTVKKIWRYPLCACYKSKLKYDRFTIISSDCTGGVLYRDLGLPFLSPTINLTVPNSIDFFERLEHYLRLEPVPNGYSQEGYPLMLLEDLEIVGVHYRNHDALIGKWNERRKRVVWDRIIVMSNDKFISTEADKERFSKLPYPKMLFSREKTGDSYVAHAPALAAGKDLTAYCDLLGRRYIGKYLDCVQFLNESVAQAEKINRRENEKT